MWARTTSQAIRPLIGAAGLVPVLKYSQHQSSLKSEDKKDEKLMFHIGTNNWQRQGEFAPGSGILHASFHQTFNSMPGVKCYSIYPSKVQTDPATEPDYEPTFKIFKLDHDIPICESVSPNSSYRWHSMTNDQFAAYRKRLENEVCSFMDEIEQREGKKFDYLISHHAFTNAMTGAQILDRRQAEGNKKLRHFNFVHGTALKMYIKEKEKDPEYPLRFLPVAQEHGVFNGTAKCSGIWVNSRDYIGKFLECFPTYPASHCVYSQIGVNQKTFCPKGSTVEKDLAKHLREADKAKLGGIKRVVTFVGKFADWKRLDAVLYAAKQYEEKHPDVATLIVGSGPKDAIAEYEGLAKKLGLKRTFFLGPKGQPVLAELFTMSEVGLFPSYKEPFGMVFVECFACGCPAIGAKSGGPVEFVNPEQGVLVPEEESWRTPEGAKRLGGSIAKQVDAALTENWKKTKGPGCVKFVKENFSTMAQCQAMVDDMKKWSEESGAKDESTLIDTSCLTNMSKNDDGLLPQPESPKYRTALVEIFDTSKATGGSDKLTNGHRFDSIPMANGMIKSGMSCQIVNYVPSEHDKFFETMKKFDAVVVRCNPGQITAAGGDQNKFDADMQMLSKSMPVWPTADVMTKMGAKDALCQIKDMDFGLPDTLGYYSPEDMKSGFRKTIAFQPRVVKQNRGSAGEGIWIISLKSGKYCKNFGDRLAADDEVLVLKEANDNHVEEHTVGEFIEFCTNGRTNKSGKWTSIGTGKYFAGGKEAGGQMVDQRFLPDIEKGESRFFMLGMELYNIEHYVYVGGVGGETVTTVYPPNAPEYAATKAKLERETPIYMKALGLDMGQLPLLWAADFIPVTGHKHPLVIGEFNCSCLGVTGFLDARGKDMSVVSPADQAKGQKMCDYIGTVALKALEARKK